MPGNLDRETEGRHGRTPLTMWLPMLLALALAVIVGSLPELRRAVRQHARQFQDSASYIEYVRGTGPWHDGSEPLSPEDFSFAWRPILCAVLALALALVNLFPHALGNRFGEASTNALKTLMHPFHTVHSGRVGDYVAWFMLGMALWGALILLR